MQLDCKPGAATINHLLFRFCYCIVFDLVEQQITANIALTLKIGNVLGWSVSERVI